MNLFISGVSGFSGSHVLSHMMRQGYGVWANSRRPSPELDALAAKSERLVPVYGDLGALDRLPGNIDAVVHVAATSPAPGVPAEAIERDTRRATENLVHLAMDAGVRKFIFFSSLSVYGDIADTVVDETTKAADPDVYGAGKRAGEAALERGSDSMSSIAMRLPSVLGPGAARHWLAGVVEKAKQNWDIHIYNPKAPFNNAVHIEDLCLFVENLLAASWKGFEAVTLGAAGPMSVHDIVATVIAAAGSSSRIVVDAEPRHSFTVSSRKAAERFGYRPLDMKTLLDRYLAESFG